MRLITVLVDGTPTLHIKASSWEEFIEKLTSGAFTEDEYKNNRLKDISENWSDYRFSDINKIWFCLDADIISFTEVPVV